MTERHILITGGAGYIGSILTSELLRQNYRVTILDSLLFGGESIVPFLSHPNFHFVKTDVTEPRAVRDALRGGWQKPDTVIHLAAIVGFPACQAVGKQVAWRYNVEATKTVFGQASDLGAERFVFASTYSNYGLSEDGKPVTEESPLNPQSLYAETKIASEEFLLSQKDAACAPLLFRFATLYGVSPRTRFDLIVNQFVLEAYKNSRVGEPSPQAGNSLSPRSPASTALRMRAGMTCEVARLKLSRGPYRFTGKRKMALKPYCWRYACACTSIIFLARP